ncbi:gustatory receptor for sugar taste 64a-like [Vanessa atalanta]|uniref:gustatory receptor for sugar taste 64a-like n=1 Tax=Vanessa atalanta TaxID=42275 RepID=UPI001FCDE9EF|nr:gustatory receptor for sugar taste 64a-like [Vanessa atalanta]
MTTVFMIARWFGIPTYGGSFFLYWALIILTMLTAIDAAAIWKLVQLLSGTATNNTSGHEYTLWLAIPIFIMSKSATILWNFQDLIVILISMGLTSRYYRMNSFVKYVIRYEKRAGKVKKFGTDYCFQANTWCRIRQAYVQQAALVRKIDEDLGPLVFLSNLNNLYFICLQLFLGIRRIDGTLINKIYYFFSLGWLILRASSVVLSAADISLHSKRALPYLHSCPSSAYNIEIKRLKDQLSHDVIVLSGMGYFYLDRQKLLQVAAAIVKYELILLQYDN